MLNIAEHYQHNNIIINIMTQYAQCELFKHIIYSLFIEPCSCDKYDSHHRNGIVGDNNKYATGQCPHCEGRAL